MLDQAAKFGHEEARRLITKDAAFGGQARLQPTGLPARRHQDPVQNIEAGLIYLCGRLLQSDHGMLKPTAA